MHKEIFKNASFQILSRVATTIIGFVITILIARSFGVSQFGEFAKIISYVSIFYLFVDLGINAFFLKDPRSFSTLLYLRLFIASFVFIFSNLVAYILPYDPIGDTGFSPTVRLGIFIFSISYFAQALIFSTAGVFQKSLKYDKFLISQIAGASLNLFLICILIFFAKPLNFILVSFTISSFATSVISLFFIKEKLGSIDVSYGKKLLTSSLPLGLMLVFNLIYFRIDILILSVFKSSADVGTYSIAYRFFDFFIAIPLFLSNALYPKLLSTINNKKTFSKLLKNYFFVYLLISILIIIPVSMLSPLFTLISPEFINAKLPFRILILSLPVFFLTSFLQWVLISKDHQKFLLYAYLICALLNIFLNIMLIPKFSYLASAIVTVFCETLVLILLTAKLFNSRIISEHKT